MTRLFVFEKLSVWQNSRKLVKYDYCLTNGMLANVKFGLDLDTIVDGNYFTTREMIDTASCQLNQLGASALSKPSQPTEPSQQPISYLLNLLNRKLLNRI